MRASARFYATGGQPDALLASAELRKKREINFGFDKSRLNLICGFCRIGILYCGAIRATVINSQCSSAFSESPRGNAEAINRPGYHPGKKEIIQCLRAFPNLITRITPLFTQTYDIVKFRFWNPNQSLGFVVDVYGSGILSRLLFLL